MSAFRLGPGTDLKQELARIAKGLQAGFVATCVGSLSRGRLRMPSAVGEPEAIRSLEEPMEILSLAGTLSPDGLHLHIAVATRDGQSVGGHLLDGCIVHTTAEIILGELTELVFHRSPDPETGYLELSTSRR
jgi:predicted DNA-binding protein with PD1-like motif